MYVTDSQDWLDEFKSVSNEVTKAKPFARFERLNPCHVVFVACYR
jgi:hypothetical protein